ncbi:MAG: hypothetical protein HY286_15325 [Planctomycetes bacterium]|nr:hypothetical protein [Planctomycetota bacterium]
MRIQGLSLERALLIGLVGAVAYLAGRLHSGAPLYANAPDGVANSNSKMIAVTGPYQQGVSLLYIIDTESRQLSVYEARGGSRSGGRINFVGARRIDFDLRLEGYHDDSEFSYSDLATQFRKSGWNDTSPEKSGTNGEAVPAKAGNKPADK